MTNLTDAQLADRAVRGTPETRADAVAEMAARLADWHRVAADLSTELKRVHAERDHYRRACSVYEQVEQNRELLT